MLQHSRCKLVKGSLWFLDLLLQLVSHSVSFCLLTGKEQLSCASWVLWSCGSCLGESKYLTYFWFLIYVISCAEFTSFLIASDNSHHQPFSYFFRFLIKAWWLNKTLIIVMFIFSHTCRLSTHMSMNHHSSCLSPTHLAQNNKASGNTRRSGIKLQSWSCSSSAMLVNFPCFCIFTRISPTHLAENNNKSRIYDTQPFPGETHARTVV